MRVVSDQSWSRRGLSLLWGAEALSRIAQPDQVVSVRQLFALSRAWPEDLPAVDGNAVVVAGVDGCLDALGPEDATQWLEEDFRRIVVGFQDRYENQAALILWIPDGRRRIAMPRATEEYEWHCSGSDLGKTVPVGRCLWAGADSDTRRILDSREANQDPDGPAWIGLNHPRIS
jgi:hypothetical protein